MNGYSNPLSYLVDELKRIDLVLLYHVHKCRLEQPHQGQDEFRGLYISEDEVDALFQRPEKIHHQSSLRSALSDLKPIADAIEQKSKEIEFRKKQTHKDGIVFPLDRLQKLFGLDQYEREMLLLTLAPELHLKYEKIYAYLQDNVTKKRPTVDLMLTLSSRNFSEKLVRSAKFGPTAPLIANHLLYLFDEPGSVHSPLFAKWVKVDEGIAAFLKGEDGIDARLVPFAAWINPQMTITSLPHDEGIKKRLSDLGASIRERSERRFQRLLLYFSGPYGVGKKSAAEALCRKARLNLLDIDVGRMVTSSSDPHVVVDLILREARLKNAVIFLGHVDEIFQQGDRAQQWNRILFDKIKSYQGITIFSGSPSIGGKYFVEGLPFVQVEFPIPSYPLRKRLWKSKLSDVGLKIPSADLTSVSSRFRLTGGQVRDIISTMKTNRHNSTHSIDIEDLEEACRNYSRHKLVDLAVKVIPRRTWDDLILPKDQMDTLQEICNTVKHRFVVLDQWGFANKLVLSEGVNVLFAGPSGTGKTMATEIVANELGLDMFKIDLSGLVSKYIGETEKNLARIFSAAETSNAILFFDEADALFGKRSEVKDAHDRYANIEISYLLQKMEEYQGITILATNLRKNMDQAFVRRMAFTVHFPFPEEGDRLRIWKSIWPSETPRAKDLDLAFMARQFKLAGGNIRNIVVAAAYLAAEDGQMIDMEHLIQATKRELQKIGKVVVEREFGKYAQLV
jgi:SpoVK/Ycf46/Vps4 family AAA+-type ATPase